ncbi:MAG: 2-hydroxyacyl-CoA dehydratase subunit D [Candidatus Helarchaeota archaeon]
MTVTEFKRDYELWDTLIQFFTLGKEMADAMADSPGSQTFNTLFIEVMIEYLNNMYKAIDTNTPIAMYNFCVPPELFYAAGIYPMCQEIGSVALAIANTKVHMDYIDTAEQSGLAREQCNAQKIWIGASLQHKTPDPDLIVYASQPCDSTNILYQVMQHIYNVPTFTMDIPTWHYDDKNEFYDEQVIPYCASQLKDMIDYIEKSTKRKITFEALQETFKNSNIARGYILEVMELLKNKPCPVTSMTPFTLYMTLMSSAGLSGKVIEYSKWVRDTAKEFVKQKRSPMEEYLRKGKTEKYRCFWVYIPIFFDPLIFGWMEEKFQISTVMDMMGYQMAQPVNIESEETMLEDLAKTVLEMPMARQSRGPMEFYLDDCVNIVKEYDIDFCIWGGHMGCKHSWAIANLMKERIKEETGAPTLLFQVDTMDSRVIGSRSVRKRIREFVKEVIE